MTDDEKKIEEMIQDKGKTAPRLVPDDLDNAIDEDKTQYFVFPGTTTTICLIQLHNGFTVTGESAAVSLDNFDEEIGREIAFKEARNKLWPFLGFALKERLAVEANMMTNPSEAG